MSYGHNSNPDEKILSSIEISELYLNRIYGNLDAFIDHPQSIASEDLDGFIYGDGGGESLANCYSVSFQKSHKAIGIERQMAYDRELEEKEREVKVSSFIEEMFERQAERKRIQDEKNEQLARRAATNGFHIEMARLKKELGL